MDCDASTTNTTEDSLKTCTQPGCNRPHNAKGLCRAHYQRLRSGVDLAKPFEKREKGAWRGCAYDGCTSRRFARGHCRLHYNRMIFGTPLDRPKQHGALPNGGTCNEPGCTETVRCKGKCARHYQQGQRRGDYAANDNAIKRATPRLCEIPTCTKRRKHKGFCYSHYRAFSSPLPQQRRCEECRLHRAQVVTLEEEAWLCTKCFVELNTPARAKPKRKKAAA